MPAPRTARPAHATGGNAAYATANLLGRFARTSRRPARTASFLAACTIAIGCWGCAKVDTSGAASGSGGFGFVPGGTAGTSGSGSGNAPGGGGAGLISGGGSGRSDAGQLMSSGDAGICQQAQYRFEPKIPTVYLVVDRSGSMFDCISTTSVMEPSCAMAADTTWTKLKEGVLPVVQQLEAEVRFGFATVVGTNPRFGGMCPIADKVAPALGNYGSISRLYNALAPGPNSTQSGMKFETPTELVLGTTGAELMADPSPGNKYILFVTDGEPDYCGDGNQLCAPDGVIGQIQKLNAAGITTIVFGVQVTSIQTLAPGILEAFANAGAGEPTLAPLRGTNPRIEDIYDQCFNMGAPADDAPGGWTRSFLATGKPQMRGQTIGTYAAAAGPTKPYRPDVTNQQALINEISSALSGVKSCTFDLNNVDGKALKVNLQLLSRAHVLVEGTEVPLDDVNGWKMTNQSQLDLVGAACERWRMPAIKKIDFQFPCELIVPE